MEQFAHDDRRRAYRYEPPAVMEPILNLIHDGARTRADNVVDINSRGTRVSFGATRAPRLNPGQTLTASIQAPGLDGCVDIASRVVFNARQGERQVIALVFTAVPDLSDRIEGDFFSLFNRRQNPRQNRDQSLSAVLLGSDGGDATGFQLEIINHNAKGLAFVVDSAVDRLIRGRESVDLAIESTDNPTPQRHRARILHRVERDHDVFYGCMFSA